MVIGRGGKVTKIGFHGRCFTVNFLKIYRTPFLKKNSRRLLLSQSNYLICTGKNMLRINNRAKRNLLETKNKDNKAT